MSRIVLPILLLQIISLPCSAFISGINHRPPLAQSPFTTSGALRFANRRHRNHCTKDINESLQITKTSTQLSLHPTTGATLAIAGSSLFGMQVSRFFPSGGILGTLVSAAFFGNVCTKWVPNQHPLYDLCFTLFLPGSLTLLLLAYKPPQNETKTTTTIQQKTTKDAPNSISTCIRRIAVPFVITSLASLLGCWLSYWCSGTFGWFQSAGASTSLEKANELARITTGCMSASYVGGSVNFMSTARIVGAPADLLGSLVTADLFTMAIYFSFLSSSLDWDWLRSKFASPKETKGPDTEVAASEASETTLKPQSANQETSLSNLKSFASTSIPLLLSTYFIVKLANNVEGYLGRFVPGSACALIAIVAPLLNSLVQSKKAWIPFSNTATIWSDFFFLSFFASIGVAANLSSALSMGPTCLLFSTIALTVHVLGTVFGCLVWKRVLALVAKRTQNDPLSLDLEDVWIASNAAIGGPATAAAFCGQMRKRDPAKLQGRTISATVWGVVGYAIGTIVGVSMYKMV